MAGGLGSRPGEECLAARAQRELLRYNAGHTSLPATFRQAHDQAALFLLILLRKLVRDIGAKRFVGANPELFRNRFVAILVVEILYWAAVQLQTT